MLSVDVLETTKQGQMKLGTISWDGSQLSADPPDDPALRNMLRMPLSGGLKVGFIDPDKDPEKFLECLHVQYTGSYLRASKARQDKGRSGNDHERT